MKTFACVGSATRQAVLLGLLVSPPFLLADTEPTVHPPAWHLDGPFWDYPAAARRLAEQARYLVEFSITTRGRVTDVTIIQAEAPDRFIRALARNMQVVRFATSADWLATGGATRRYRANVLFLLRPCIPENPCEDLVPFTADTVITFLGTPVKQVPR